MISERKKISNQVKTIYNKTFTTISVVFDKRWKTYICIFKNSGSQKSLYLGKHDLILETLRQYYRKDEFDNSVDFLKTELKRMLVSIKVRSFQLPAIIKLLSKRKNLKILFNYMKKVEIGIIGQ